MSLTDAEISERMSGNICRCAAYPNIVDAIREVAGNSGEQAIKPAPRPATAQPAQEKVSA